MLYVPGNNAGMVKDAHIYRSDSVMFDLEDSVSINEKDSARILIFNALKTLDYEGIEIRDDEPQESCLVGSCPVR